MREGGTAVDDINRKDGNSFHENYSKHDIAEDYLRFRFDAYGYDVDAYGIDKRDADTENFLTDDKPDLEISRDSDVVGYVEVKSKSSSEWMGNLNLKHFEKYLDGDDREDDPFEGARELDVPVYVYFVLVQDGCVTDEFAIPVESERQIESTFRYDNIVACLDDDERVDWFEMLDSF